jgi:transposase
MPTVATTNPRLEGPPAPKSRKRRSNHAIHALQQFARVLSRDIDADRNAIAEPWSSGQAEGQINRLKTLKRAMFGRAGIELLRARMLPLQ